MLDDITSCKATMGSGEDGGQGGCRMGDNGKGTCICRGRGLVWPGQWYLRGQRLGWEAMNTQYEYYISRPVRMPTIGHQAGETGSGILGKLAISMRNLCHR